MKNKAVFYVLSIILLLVFTYTSCSSPFSYLPKEAAYHQIEIGKGTPYYVYLDSDNNPINTHIGINDPDPGKTAVVVLDNPMAEGVMALAETTASGTTVSIINNNDDTVIYMFYQSGKNFPSSLVIEAHGEHVNGYLSSYDTQKESYSIAFEQGEESFILNDVTMTKNILSVYTDDTALTGAQNTRLRNIYTALGVFASLNVAISADEDNSTVFLGWSWFTSKMKNFIVGALLFVAVIAFCVAVVLAPPAAISIVGASIVISGGSIGSAVAAGIGIGVVALVEAIVVANIEPYEENEATQPPQTKTLFVTIKKVEDVNIYDLNETVFYIAPKDTIKFEIDFLERVTNQDDIQYLFYDAAYNVYNIVPANIFPLTFKLNGVVIPKNNITTKYLPQGNSFNLEITRDASTSDGNNDGHMEGYIDFVLSFRAQETFMNNDAKKIVPTTIYDENGNPIEGRFCHIRLTLNKDYAKPKT